MAKATAKKTTTKAAKGKPAQRGKKKLTLKQDRFINNYLANGGNATRAAKDAGYSEKTAYQTASENLRKPEIAERIQARLDEQKVTSDEVVGTLAAQMRGSVIDLLPDDGGLVTEIKKNNLGHLVKKIRIRREIDPSTHKPFEVVEIEGYSSQAAAVQLSKIKGLEIAPAENPRDKVERVIDEYLQTPPGKGKTRQQAAQELYNERYYAVAEFYEVKK